MDSEGTSWHCCCNLELATRTILTADVFLVILAIFDAEFMIGGDPNSMTKTLARLSVLKLFSNIRGLCGINQKKPTRLIEALLGKILIAAILIMVIYEANAHMGSLFHMVGGAVAGGIFMWTIYSATIVFRCYRKIKKELDIIKPIIAETVSILHTEPCNQLIPS